MYAVQGFIEGLEVGYRTYDTMSQAIARVVSNSGLGLGSELIEDGHMMMWVPAYSTEAFLVALVNAKIETAHEHNPV